MADKQEQLVDARPIQPSTVVQQQTPVTASSSSVGQQVVYAVPVYAGSGAPPSQQGMQGTQTVYALPQATVVGVVQTGFFGDHPARAICQYCGADVITGVKVTPSITAHLWALGLCVFGCWPCCVVPYFVKECQSYVHSCPNCGHEIAFHGL